MNDTLGKGYIQVYTGNGKGKTTAAIGLSIRAAGAGLKVFFAQFVKGKPYSEIQALEKNFDNITIRQYGRGCFINREPSKEDILIAQQGLADVKCEIESGKYDVVVLDEANIAVNCKLFSIEGLLDLVKCRPEGMEIIITGRYARDEVIEVADLVTEMKEIKHYYRNGLQAREGIEK